MSRTENTQAEVSAAFRRRWTLRECVQMANTYQERARDLISIMRSAHEYGFDAPARTLADMHLARLESKRFRRMAFTRQLLLEVAEKAGLVLHFEV